MPMRVDSPEGTPPQHPPRPDTPSVVVGLHAWPPVASPYQVIGRYHGQSHYNDESVNALSFGFLATAILISMFLVMAVIERFILPANPPRADPRDIEGGKPRCLSSPKMKVYDSGVSVLMPGDEVPSFIAHPAPISHPPDHHSWPMHQQTTTCQRPIWNASSTPSHSR